MDLALSRRDFFQIGATGSLSLVAGCGMIMHPERRNQPTGGGLDWTVVGLDTLGFLLFFIPGVIAFAVDFTTGAIYLPPQGYGDSGRPAKDPSLVAVHVPQKDLNQARLEQVVSQHAGRDVQANQSRQQNWHLGGWSWQSPHESAAHLPKHAAQCLQPGRLGPAMHISLHWQP